MYKGKKYSISAPTFPHEALPCPNSLVVVTHAKKANITNNTGLNPSDFGENKKANTIHDNTRGIPRVKRKCLDRYGVNTIAI